MYVSLEYVLVMCFRLACWVNLRGRLRGAVSAVPPEHSIPQGGDISQGPTINNKQKESRSIAREKRTGGIFIFVSCVHHFCLIFAKDSLLKITQVIIYWS